MGADTGPCVFCGFSAAACAISCRDKLLACCPRCLHAPTDRCSELAQA